MTLKPLYLDYDEVLVDLITPWIDWINHTLKDAVCFHLKGKPLELSDIKTYDWLRRKFGDPVNEFWNLPETYNIFIDPLPGAVEFIDSIRDKYDITIVSYCSPSNVDGKRAHALKYFGIENFISAGDKWHHTKDGVLVDDNVGNIAHHCWNNKRAGIIFNYQNTRLWCDEIHFDLEAPACKGLTLKANNYDSLKEQIEAAFLIEPPAEWLEKQRLKAEREAARKRERAERYMRASPLIQFGQMLDQTVEVALAPPGRVTETELSFDEDWEFETEI